MSNLKTLVKIQPGEDAREKGRKGGIASGIARREKRTFRETMEECLNQMIERRDKDGKVLDKVTAQEAICLKQIEEAVRGSTRAAKFCSETTTPKQLEITGANGEPLQQSVKYITPETLEEIKKHIAEVIN